MKILPLAKNLPQNVGPIHFVGIGGIGMSGIAEVLHNLGYTVRGSDVAESSNVDRLRGMGIQVMIGHAPENVEEAAVVVISSAVKRDNPEVLAAREKLIPVVRRSEMLAELMRLKIAVAIAGTHGKTTTTSMVAALFEAGKLDPTVINGGIINTHNTNAYVGKSDWMVVEADESDGTFVRVRSTIAIVTNIDPEHLDYYGSYDNVKAAFRQFIENIPFYGFAVMCIDHPEVQRLIGDITDRRILAYGLSPQADVRAVNIRQGGDGSRFDVELSDRVQGGARTITDVHIPMHGAHNILNALAATAVAAELQFASDTIKRGFVNFKGVKRRFTVTGVVGGVTIVDDYGHHPVEIAATLKAGRDSLDGRDAKVIAVVQPHRYTRLRDLFKDFCTCFNDADAVIVADVYAAGEPPIEGIDRDALVNGLRDAGHRNVSALASEEALAQTIKDTAKPGDVVICLGAGSITYWAAKLPKALEQLQKKGA